VFGWSAERRAAFGGDTEVVAVQGMEVRVGHMRPDMPLEAPRPRTASNVEPHLPPLAAFEQPSPRQFVPSLSQDPDSSDDERGVGGVRLALSPKPAAADALEPYTAAPAPALVTADSLRSPASAFVPPRELPPSIMSASRAITPVRPPSGSVLTPQQALHRTFSAQSFATDNDCESKMVMEAVLPGAPVGPVPSASRPGSKSLIPLLKPRAPAAKLRLQRVAVRVSKQLP
jgi:hypothetical protein